MYHKRLELFLFLVCVLRVSFTAAQTGIELGGSVRCSETDSSIARVNVEAAGSGIGTVTDESGFFRLRLKPGKYRIRFSHIGFEPVVKETVLTENSPFFRLDVKLSPKALELESVTVRGEARVKTISGYDLSESDIRKIPSSLPDGLLSIKTLPGVFSNHDQSGFYTVRGGSFDDNLIMLNGVEIFQPLIVRKGVMENPSAVNPWLVRSINLQTGAYPVSYGDRISSVLDITYRDGSQGGLRGMAELSTVKAEAALEGPIGKRLFFTAAARNINYGYIWKDLSTKGEFTPDFKDVQAVITWRPADNHSIQLFGLGSKSLFTSAPDSYGRQYFSDISFNIFSLSGDEQFKREAAALGLSWIYQPARWIMLKLHGSVFKQDESEKTDLSYRLTINSMNETSESVEPEDIIRNELFDNHLNFRTNRLGAEAVLRKNRHLFHLGVEQRRVYFSDYRNEAITGTYRFATDPAQHLIRRVDHSANGWAVFGQHNWQLRDWLRLETGLRYTRFDMNGEQLLLPRVRLFMDISEKTEILMAAGLYAQPPLYREIRNSDNRHNVRSQKASQVTFGILHKWQQRDLMLKVEAYYKDMTDLISYTLNDVRATYSGRNDAKGYAWGFDAFLKGQFIPGCLNWVSYSFLIAREHLDDYAGWAPRPSDQRHVLSFKLEDRMIRFPGSRMHVNLQLSSGTRYTNTRAEADETGNYHIRSGARNALRAPMYKRVDIGLTQEIQWGSFKFIFREEVLNLFNNQNVMGYTFYQNIRIPSLLGRRTYMFGVKIIAVK